MIPRQEQEFEVWPASEVGAGGEDDCAAAGCADASAPPLGLPVLADLPPRGTERVLARFGSLALSGLERYAGYHGGVGGVKVGMGGTGFGVAVSGRVGSLGSRGPRVGLSNPRYASALTPVVVVVRRPVVGTADVC